MQLPSAQEPRSCLEPIECTINIYNKLTPNTQYVCSLRGQSLSSCRNHKHEQTYANKLVTYNEIWHPQASYGHSTCFTERQLLFAQLLFPFLQKKAYWLHLQVLKMGSQQFLSIKNRKKQSAFTYPISELYHPPAPMVGSGLGFCLGVKHERTCFLACSSCHMSGQQWQSTMRPSCYLRYFLNHKISGLLTKKSQLLPKHIKKTTTTKWKNKNQIDLTNGGEKTDNKLNVEQKRERLIW